MNKLIESLQKLFEKTPEEEIQDLIDVQASDPIIKTDDYFAGLGNGLVVAKSVLTGEEPNFVNLPEKERYFIERTNNHIRLVQEAAKRIHIMLNPEESAKLLSSVKFHDKSKFQEPEKEPYIEITWRHKLEREKGEFDPINAKGYQKPGNLVKKEENEATLHHIRNNEHHPETWLEDKSEANINDKDRNKSNKVVDASRMPDWCIAEMVADWYAMSQELKKNTTKEWFESQKDVRWHYSDHQVDLIYKLIEVLEGKVEVKEAKTKIDKIVITSTDGIPPDGVTAIDFNVYMGDKTYKYKTETSPFIHNKFMNLVKKKFYGKAMNLIKPHIKTVD